MQIAIYVEVDDAANLVKLLPIMARQCVYLDEALAGQGISAESYVQSVVLSDGTVLFD
jgi:hypothetical protein